MTSTITDRLAGAVEGVAVQTPGAGIISLTQTGGTDAVQATALPAITEYSTNQIFAWIPTAANTGAMTMTIASASGAIPIKKPDGSALASGDIQVGLNLLLRHDGTNLRIIGSGF
jgi:hypothetical protein